MRRKSLLVAIFLVVLWGAISFAKSSSFTGTGKAVVVEGDRDTALKLAKDSAVKKAVASAMESMIDEGTKDRASYNLKKGELLKKPYPFLTKAKITSKVQSGNVVTVKVQIEVDKAELSKFLSRKGVLARKTERRRKEEFPSVMIVIVEEISGKVNTFPFSTAVVAEELLKRDFTVVDEQTVKKSIKHDQAVQGVLKGDNKAAISMALQYGAGILITGRAVGQKSAMKSGGMQSHGANVAIQAVQADSGRIIATATADGSYPHIDSVTGTRKAIEAASKKALENLIHDLQKELESSEESLLVSISGINYSQLAIIKKILRRDFDTITSIRQKNFAGGVAKFDVTIDSSTQDFSERVVLKDFGTFRLDVLSFSPGKIDFVLKMK